MSRRIGLLLALASLALACGDGVGAIADGGSEGRTPDGRPSPDGGTPTLSIDFTVSGCPRLETAPRCTGRAPLTIELIPLSTGPISRFRWDFGDGKMMSTDSTPSHTYEIPGVYELRVIGLTSSGESTERRRPAFVVVTQNEVGEPCEVDVQCRAPATCICGSAAKCPAAFVRGLCTTPCGSTDAACRAGEVCAELSATARGVERPEGWQRALCLRSCVADEECPAGLRCRDLPGRVASGPWVRGCFADHPRPIGTACRGANGALRHELCVTGHCADLGASGYCTLDCGTGACPSGSSCAELGDRRRLCLRPCGPNAACDGDPLLACAPPNLGPLGYALMAGGGSGPHCAPKRCNVTADCPGGDCRDSPTGAHCVRRVD